MQMQWRKISALANDYGTLKKNMQTVYTDILNSILYRKQKAKLNFQTHPNEKCLSISFSIWKYRRWVQ